MLGKVLVMNVIEILIKNVHFDYMQNITPTLQLQNHTAGMYINVNGPHLSSCDSTNFWVEKFESLTNFSTPKFVELQLLR